MQGTERVVQAADGRLLSVSTAGQLDDDPVFVLHGTPGVCEMFKPELEKGACRNMGYASYSRPGYGGSDRQPGRSVADCASDIDAIADRVGVESFYVIGESGGGPHALACAALMPDRVRAVALVASLAPPREMENWERGMGEGNLEELEAAKAGPDVLRAHLEVEIQKYGSAKTVNQLRDALDKHLDDPDRAVFDGGFGAFLLTAWQQIAEDGIWGWFDDDLALYGDWGFDLGHVVAPVTVWQGRNDLIVPLAHGKWLAEILPKADFRLLSDTGHISMVADNFGAILDSLIGSKI